MEKSSLQYEKLNKKVLELQKRLERYELSVAGSTSGLWDWDVLSDKVYYSDRFKELLGYEPEDFSNSPDEFWKRVHADDFKLVELAINAHLEKQIPYIIDYRLQNRSGKYHWFHARGKALWKEKGKATRMSGSITDITEYKKADEKLITSEERARNLMEQSPLPIEILTPEGKITQVNSAWSKLWGLDKKGTFETLKKYNMLTDPQLEDLGIADLVKKAFSGQRVILPPVKYDPGQAADDFGIKGLKNLKIPWFQCHLYPVLNKAGDMKYLVNTYVDITDLKKSEEIISKSEKRYRHLIEHSPLSIAIFTPDGKLSQVNDAWRELWGLNEEETAKVIANYNFLTDKQIEGFGHAPLVEKAFNGEHVILPLMRYEGNRAIKDMELEDIEAQLLWIQTHIYPVIDMNGEIDTVVGINMDFTELKKTEEEVQRQRDVLARIDRASSMGQLTGSIAHELNQPLTGILSNAQAAELIIKSGKWKEEGLLEILSDIVNDAKRGGEVIRNLRDLYRLQEVEFNPFNINEVITDTLKILHSELILHHVTISVKTDSSIPILKGNKIQIQQVLVNLIMNAIQAMSAMDENNRQLHIVTTYDRNVVKTGVKDCGRGIKKDKIARIFEPLATWKPRGTGMGLAISNSIIESHGGKMFAKNSPEGGAIVGFELPLSKMDLKIND